MTSSKNFLYSENDKLIFFSKIIVKTKKKLQKMDCLLTESFETFRLILPQQLFGKKVQFLSVMLAGDNSLDRDSCMQFLLERDATLKGQ